jgi:hypothetical protein
MNLSPRQFHVNHMLDGNMNHQDMKLQCQFGPACRSGSIGFQVVCCAAAAKLGVYFIFDRVQRLEYVTRQSRQRGAASFGGSRSRDSKITPHTNRNASMPNPSFKPSLNSVARRPASAGPAAHFALAVQRATLLVPA